MPGAVHKYDGEFVIEDIGDLKNNYDEYTSDSPIDTKESAELTKYVPIFRIVPGVPTLRGRSSAYTPSKGGNPLDMGK
tara:strand:+ start:542 stop:775 length:234 start_codon:yes stop_codon:yes gene_type:complete